MNSVGGSHRDFMRTFALSLLLVGALAAWTIATPAFARSAKPTERDTQKSSPPEVPTGPAASQLWATIDVCNAADQPGALGIRGSMPGEARMRGSVMYVDFQVQYLVGETGEWAFLGKEGESGWLKLGSATLTRQAGRTFQLQLPTPQEAATFTLRGLVSYQWRRGTRVLKSLTRVTTAGHRAIAGADPPGYSAATCSMG